MFKVVVRQLARVWGQVGPQLPVHSPRVSWLVNKIPKGKKFRIVNITEHVTVT